jgi:hypothetical protein
LRPAPGVYGLSRLFIRRVSSFLTSKLPSLEKRGTCATLLAAAPATDSKACIRKR